MKNYDVIKKILMCFLFSQLCFCEETMNNLDQTLNIITSKTGRDIEKKFKFLKLLGTGGSLSIDKIINYEKLVFNVTKKLTKDDGVLLISKIVGEYLRNFYSEKAMETYLKKHTFNEKNLEIVLITHEENDDPIWHPNIRFFSLYKGILNYRTVSKSEKYILKTESDIDEPYEQALKRLGL